MTITQGDRSWQPFGKNGHKNFCPVCIYFFRDRVVVFARNCIFANLTQYDMQYLPCRSAFLAQDTLFLTQKALFLPKDFQKVRKSRQILILRQSSVLRRPFLPSHNFCHPAISWKRKLTYTEHSSAFFLSNVGSIYLVSNTQ